MWQDEIWGDILLTILIESTWNTSTRFFDLSSYSVLKTKQVFKNKNVGIVLTGGNVDLKNLPF